MADAVLSVEVRARLEQLSRGLGTAEKSIEDFVNRGDRHISVIEKRFESMGKSTKEIAENIKASFGGISLDKYFQSFGNGKEIIAQSKVEVQKYKEEIERLKKVGQDLSNQIKEKTKALNDSKTATQNAKTATEEQRRATEAERTSAAASRAEIAKLTLEKRKNSQQTKAASGSYREAQQRLTALGKAIRETGNGFDLTNPKVKAQVAQYKALNNQLKQFDASMGNYQRNVGNYGSALSSISPQLSMLAGRGGGLIAVALAARDAYQTVSQFDTGMRNVEKTTGLTRREVDALGKDFVSLSRSLKTISANDLTQYATVAGQLGVKGTKNILAFTEALAKLETATNISGEEGGAEIARTLTLIDGGVQNVKAFGDEIVNLGNNFAATEKEILGNAEAIAQNTAIYGFGRQEVLAFATATKSLGVEAEVVGSTFQKTLGTFEKAIRTGDGLDEILKVIGGSAEDLQDRFRVDAAGVFQDYIKGLNGIQKAGGSVMAQMEKNGIKDIRQRRVIGTLANGYDTLARSMDTVRDAAGALDQEFEVKAGSIANQTGRIKIAWDNLILSIENGTGAIGKTSVAFADMTATILESLTNIVTSQSWKEFFIRLGEMSGNKSLSFAAKGMGDLSRMESEGVGGNRRGLTSYEDMKEFYRMTEDQQRKELLAQEKLVRVQLKEYQANKDNLKIRDSMLWNAEKLAKMRAQVIKPVGSDIKGKVDAGGLSESEIKKLDSAREKAQKSYEASLSKIEKIRIDSSNRASMAELSGIAKVQEGINQKYAGWIADIKKVEEEAKNNKALSAQQILAIEAKTQEEITALQNRHNQERAAAYTKYSNEIKAKQAKLRDEVDASRRKQKAPETVELVYQRRFNETAIQRGIRAINKEYKDLEETIDKTVETLKILGIQLDSTGVKNDLQNRYYEDIEKEYRNSVDIQMALVDGRNKFNAAIEKTSILIQENERQMAAIDLDSSGGREKLMNLKAQNEELRYQQDILNATNGIWSNIGSTISDSFATSIVQGENLVDVLGNGMESVLTNIIKTLIDMGIQLLANKALSIGSITATAAAGKTATTAATAANVAAAKITAGAWATPAALVSAATFGASAAAGGAALAGTIASANALSMLQGFSDGGYTGSIAENQIAGVVHGKEFVFDAESTRRLGVNNLKALQQGKIPSVSDFTPRITKNNSNFTKSGNLVKKQEHYVKVSIEGQQRNNVTKYAVVRATREEKKFGRG